MEMMKRMRKDEVEEVANPAFVGRRTWQPNQNEAWLVMAVINSFEFGHLVRDDSITDIISS